MTPEKVFQTINYLLYVESHNILRIIIFGICDFVVFLCSVLLGCYYLIVYTCLTYWLYGQW